MAKTKISEWDSVAANNTDINNININEGCPPSTINNAIRETMAQVKNYIDGSSGDYLVNSGGITSNGTTSLNGTTSINGQFRLNGSAGFSGQVFKSNGSTNPPSWQSLGTMSTQDSNGVNITGGSVKTTGDLNVTGALKLDNGVGLSGQVLVSTGSNATPNWGNAFVTGMIMLWSGSTGSVPSGWRICDGGGGTPDLRSKFVIGAGSSYAVNATGGNANATLVSHSHTASTSVATKTGLNGTLTLLNRGGSSGAQSLMRARSGSVTIATSGQGNFGTGWEGEGGSNSSKATFALNHNHTASTSVNSSGTSGTNANLPPYYALAYIMRL